MLMVILNVAALPHAHHVLQIPLVCEGSSILAREASAAILLEYEAERLMVWFGLWIGHTWNLCLLYSGISIECAKCWMASRLVLWNLMQQTLHWGHWDRRSVNAWAKVRTVSQFYGTFGLPSDGVGEVTTAYPVTTNQKCCQSFSTLTIICDQTPFWLLIMA